MTMTSRELVHAALMRRQPDRVPYCELGVNRSLAQQLMGWGPPLSQSANLEANQYTIDEAKALADFLKLDNISYVLRAPVYAEKHAGQDGILFYGDGHIKTAADLAMVALPDPTDPALYAEAEAFVRQKGDFSAWFITRISIFPTMLSMGIEGFSVALYEDRPLVERLLDMYTDWIVEVAQRVCRLGFDVFASTDDMAFNTDPFFSPKVFRELVLPSYQRVAKHITIPWFIHSDGNILPFLDDLASVGVIGEHPNEKGAVDIRAVKRQYGDRLCILGNIDLDRLSRGTPAEAAEMVKRNIDALAYDGGYCVGSSNSVTYFVPLANYVAMIETAKEYGGR
jgi:uroporphyrinogen decarboxylase